MRIGVGRRVEINNPDHPWFGHSGFILGSFESKLKIRGRPASSGWRVALDNGRETVAKPSDVHRASA